MKAVALPEENSLHVFARPWHAFAAGIGSGEVAPRKSETGPSGLRSPASAGKAATCSSDPQLQQSSGVAAYAQSVIGECTRCIGGSSVCHSVCTLLFKLNKVNSVV